MNLRVPPRLIRHRAILALGLSALSLCGYVRLQAQQEAAPMYLLDWVDVPKSSTLFQRLREQLSRVTDFFVRVTSPDVPAESRRLWRIDAGGEGNCLLTTDTGVRYPRWGSAGHILYLVEADTNGDGRIDFEDEFLIRVVSSAGGLGTTVGQGRSAVWSPDGKYIAFVTQGQIKLTTAAGGVVPRGSATPPGKLIFASGRSPDTAHDFWAVD